MARILIADDDATLREALRNILIEDGFDVIEASDGAATLHTLRSQQADLVLCDMFMPDKDGVETIRELRREFPTMKIIAMSGGGLSGMLDILPIAQRLGAAEILQKPFTRTALLAALSRVLASG